MRLVTEVNCLKLKERLSTIATDNIITSQAFSNWLEVQNFKINSHHIFPQNTIGNEVEFLSSM